MNKLIIISLMSILSIGCAPSFQTEPQRTMSIEPELLQYVESFQADSNRLGRPMSINDLVVQFDTLPDRVIANCTRGYGTPIIRFSITYYNYYKSQGLDHDIEQVMYHELGHCILGLNHNDTTGVNNWPQSIMNTYHFSGSLYYNYKNDYLMQLFFNVPNNFTNYSNLASKVLPEYTEEYYVSNEVQ